MKHKDEHGYGFIEQSRVDELLRASELIKQPDDGIFNRITRPPMKNDKTMREALREELVDLILPIEEARIKGLCHPNYKMSGAFSRMLQFIDAQQPPSPAVPVDVVERADKLQAFKDYVHKRLDDAGIPENPGGEHSKHGCRIGDRLDIALATIQPQPADNRDALLVKCKSIIKQAQPYVEDFPGMLVSEIAETLKQLEDAGV